MMKQHIKVMLAKGAAVAGMPMRRHARTPGFIVLMYHRVNTSIDSLGLTVSPDLFTSQMDHLESKYRVVSLDDALSLLSAGELKETLCVITFDDGYRDNYEVAYPVLKERGLPATIFITCDAIDQGVFGWQPFDQAILATEESSLDLGAFNLGCHSIKTRAQREDVVCLLHRRLKQQPDGTKHLVIQHVVSHYSNQDCHERTMMNWLEVKELSDSGLITIGAHTISHPILSRVDNAQARHEIMQSKQMIEQKIGKNVDYFAYPNGQPADITPDVITLVKQSGYAAGFTTIPGKNTHKSDFYYLKRFDITNSISTNHKGDFCPELFDFYLSGYFRNAC